MRKSLYDFCKENGKEFLLEEWDYEKNEELGLTPKNIGPKSSKKVYWKCFQGHPSYEAAPGDKTIHNCGCPYCSNRRILPGFNDLETYCKKKNKESLLDEWDYEKNEELGLTPKNIGPNSKKKVYWKCPQGHPSYQMIRDRVNGHSCPYCSNRRVLPGFNDLETFCHNNNNLEYILDEWDYEKNEELGLTPQTISPKSNKKVYWKCPQGHPSYQMELKAKIEDGNGCPYCSNHRVLPGFNDLETFCHNNLEYILDEWDYEKNEELGLTPQTVTPGSHKEAYFKCPQGHSSYKTTIQIRALMHSGCPCCKNSKGENKIQRLLEQLHINFIPQHSFGDRRGIGNKPLRDDFAILDDNNNVVGTIEYNGIQHYELVTFGASEEVAKKNFKLVKQNDKIKSKYLKEHGIPQLIIKYTEFDKIDTLVLDFLTEILAEANDKIA
jgi:hypothetical protein